ncbi:MAG: hypothetical protein ABSF29_09700 [Tepidisphaeraceae bacterium]|jgi:hypothetical protein
MTDEVITYRTPQPQPPRRLTLEEGPGFARVIFPVASAWSYVLAPAFFAAMAMWAIIGPFVWAIYTWRALRLLGVPPPSTSTLSVIWQVARQEWPTATFFSIIAIFALWKYRKWGRVPRILSATRKGLTDSYLGLFAMRQKHWPAHEITGVHPRPLRGDLNPRKPMRELVVSLSNKSERTFRLPTHDPKLLAQIAQRFQSLLGRR